MREVVETAIEPSRWNVVFHRKAENWFFAAIAMGEFKHVSAFAWVPELSIWLFYDVGFRRTRLFAMTDGQPAADLIGAKARGNAIVTVDVREDALPLMRAGLFCTTAVKHLIGARSSAIRPDALFRKLIAEGGLLRDQAPVRSAPRGALRLTCLYRHLIAKGGIVRDESRQPTPSTGRSEPCGRTGAGSADDDCGAAERSSA